MLTPFKSYNEINDKLNTALNYLESYGNKNLSELHMI